MKTKTQLNWKVVQVAISKIKPTPNNFKLKTEEGLSRFKHSVEKFGLAGSVIINTDFTLIDGNTRLEKAKELNHKKIWAAMPDRKLTPKEFNEFSAMYDMAKAGEVDLDRIKNELGTHEQFFKDWGLELPKEAINKLTEMELNEANIKPRTAKEVQISESNQLARITLLFDKAQAEEYLRIAESLYAKFKVDNITDLSLAALRFIKKSK